MKKTIIFAAAVLILASLYFFHFEAARQAEIEVDRTLRGMVSPSDPSAGMQFSGVEIAPFGGTLTLYDVNLFTERHLYRGGTLRFDIGYFNFLRLYFGDPSDLLDNRIAAGSRLEEVTWLDRYRLREVRFDTLRLRYSGNPRALLRHALLDSALATGQSIDAEGRGFSYTDPMLAWGAMRADTLRLRQRLPAEEPGGESTRMSEVELRNLTWETPSWFRDKYGFFIRGFEYPAEAIPLKRLRATLEYHRGERLLQFRNTRLETEHFRMGLRGQMRLADPPGRSPLDSLSLILSGYSQRFRNVLTGLNRLFELGLPAEADSLSLPLGGTLDSPALGGPPRR